jgi:Pyridoxamine 5'-phosphate oxidase
MVGCDADMGRVFESISPEVERFVSGQPVFFVATAPRSDEGHVNCSPKGLDTFRVLGPNQVAYLDLTGSGAETVAHVRENGRITLMFCAFDGKPNIVRLYGRARVIAWDHPESEPFRALFPAFQAARSIVDVDIHRVSTSCGYGVPVFRLEGDRTQLLDWAERKGDAGLREYWQVQNATSIDELPALGDPP